MSSINDACTSLAAAAAVIDGLRVKPYVDDQVNPDEGQVYNRAYDPRMTLGGSPVRMVALGLRVFVRRSQTRTAQEALRDYMEQSGPTSIIEAVENPENWPTGTNYVEVVQVGQPFEVTMPDAAYLAVDFDIDVVL